MANAVFFSTQASMWVNVSDTQTWLKIMHGIRLWDFSRILREVKFITSILTKTLHRACQSSKLSAIAPKILVAIQKSKSPSHFKSIIHAMKIRHLYVSKHYWNDMILKLPFSIKSYLQKWRRHIIFNFSKDNTELHSINFVKGTTSNDPS